jgi:hypothetical protein
MNWNSKILLLTVFVGFGCVSCKKETCKDPVPEMSFLEFYQVPNDPETYKLVFQFTDCDGDIGMESTATILDENGVVQTTNFKIDLYYFENNQWNKYEFASEDGLNSKIPVLGNSAANPILDGEIEKSLDRVFSLGGFDTIMFRSRILDNAGHYSNEVETPGFAIAQ